MCGGRKISEMYRQGVGGENAVGTNRFDGGSGPGWVRRSPWSGWPGLTGDGLELLALQEPVGEVAGDGGGEGGDEAVFLVGAEGEVVGGLQGGGILLTFLGRGRQWLR